MPQAPSLSLSKFTSTVQAAVKAAVQKHPKFKVDLPNGISVYYLIRGYPVPEAILANATVGETQAYANDVAAQIAGAHPEAFSAVHGATPQGAVLSIGRHVIVGIPPIAESLLVER